MHKTHIWQKRYFSDPEDTPWQQWEVTSKTVPWEVNSKTVKLTLDLGDTVIHEIDDKTRLVVKRDHYGDVSVTKEKLVSMWVPAED